MYTTLVYTCVTLRYVTVLPGSLEEDPYRHLEIRGKWLQCASATPEPVMNCFNSSVTLHSEASFTL